MRIIKNIIIWLVISALVSFVGLFYTVIKPPELHFNINVILAKPAAIPLLLTFVVSLLGLLVMRLVFRNRKKVFLRKSIEFLLEECDSKIMFRTYFEILCSKYVLTQDEFAPLVKKCVKNTWLYLARDVAERAGRNLSWYELNLIMFKAEMDGDLCIAQEASDMRYLLNPKCDYKLLPVKCCIYLIN